MAFKLSIEYRISRNSYLHESGCIIWTSVVRGGNNKQPYLQMQNPRYKINVCKFLLEKKLGRAIKFNRLCCHTCNKKYGPCININHIYEGTYMNNASDSMMAGIHAHGITHGEHKLKEDEVLEIKKLLKVGCLQKDLAKRFNVAASQISSINMGNTWKHIN